MKDITIMNVTAMIGGSIAIAAACKASKSAWPLLAYLLIPRWRYEEKALNSGGDQDE